MLHYIYLFSFFLNSIEARSFHIFDYYKRMSSHSINKHLDVLKLILESMEVIHDIISFIINKMPLIVVQIGLFWYRKSQMELTNILKGIKYHMLVPFCNHQFHYNLTNKKDNVINDVNYSKLNHSFQFGVLNISFDHFKVRLQQRNIKYDVNWSPYTLPGWRRFKVSKTKCQRAL